MLARDAHSSATLLALLLFLWGAVSVLLVPPRFDVANYCHMTLGGLSFIYFVWSRKRPSTRVALVFCALAVTQALIVLPWTTVVWCEFRRPLEAFTVPQVAMVSVALVIPRSLWLGVVTMLLFAADCVFTFFYARHVGLAELIPVGEPFASICFAVLGVGLLVMREKRRELARRHIRVQAELEALRRVGPRFTFVRDQLTTQLAVLTDELQRLEREGAAREASSMDRAVERLVAVGGKLGKLVEEELTPGPGGGAPGGAVIVSRAERRLLSRDTHLGAMIFVGILTVVCVAWLPVTHLRLNTMVSLIPLLALLVLSLSLLTYLALTYQRPSERRARWVTLVLYVAVLPYMSWNQVMLVALHHPYTPFLGNKMLMVCGALVATQRSWLRGALVVVPAVFALVLYFVLHLGEHKDIISVVEPWITLVYLVVGIATLVMRDQRRLASVRLLRAESDASAMHRRALMFLALRDQLNSPLQTLVVGAAQLEAHNQALELVKVNAGIEKLVALSRELADVEIPIASQSGSLDADEQLRRHAG